MLKKLVKVIALVLMGVMTFTLAACTTDFGDRTKIAAKIEITQNGKQLFEFGEDFASTGLEVSKVMADGKTSVLAASDYTVDSAAFDKTKAGTYSVVVKHETKTAKYSVMVVGLKIVELEVTGFETSFMYGSDFSTEGMIVTKVMSDGTKVVLKEGEYTVDSSKFNSEEPDEYDIIVKHKSKTFTYVATVANFDENATLKELEIFKDGKGYFEVGDAFEVGGLVLKRVMSDGSKFNLPLSLCEIDSSKFDGSKTGTYPITISYTFKEEKRTISYNVLVAEVTGIEITKAATTDFYIGDSFEADALVISRVMTGGSKAVLSSSEYTLDSSKFDGSKTGSYVISISYRTFTVSYNATVHAEYVPTPGKDVTRPITDKFKDSGAKRAYTFEAEYISFKGLTGSGHSGSAIEEGMIQDMISGASNGYSVGFMHGKDTTIEFRVYNNSDKNVDFNLMASLYSEINSVTFTPNEMRIALNDKVINYMPFDLNGVDGNAYGEENKIDIIPASGKLTLIPGWNSIKFTTLENDLKGGVTGGAGYDFINITVDKTVDLKWMPLWGNIGRRM